MHNDIEAYWRELFAEQLESVFYDNPSDYSTEGRWFDEGMRHAIMLLRHTRGIDYPPPLDK